MTKQKRILFACIIVAALIIAELICQAIAGNLFGNTERFKNCKTFNKISDFSFLSQYIIEEKPCIQQKTE